MSRSLRAGEAYDGAGAEHTPRPSYELNLEGYEAMPEDDFDVGPITPRPVAPVGFTLAQDWEAHRNETGADSAADRPDAVPAGGGFLVGDADSGGGETDDRILTKAEAILLAKLLVAYPFLSKVL